MNESCSSISTAPDGQVEEHEDPRISRLHLLGTVHGDPDGYGQLLRFLTAFEPDLLLLELSPYGLQFRREHGGRLQRTLGENLGRIARETGMGERRIHRHPEIRAIRRQLSLPFEYRAAMKYRSQRPVVVRLVDSSTFSRKMIRDWEELVSRDNLLHLLSHSMERPALRAVYRHARRRILARDGQGFPPDSWQLETRETACWERRERELCRAVTGVLLENHWEKPLYVGGWWHLTCRRSVPTLRELLGVGEERCSLLAPSTRP